jgi:hypothetical protein
MNRSMGSARLLGCALVLICMPAYAANQFKVVSDEMTDAKRGIAIINLEGIITPVVKCDRNGHGSLYISLIAKKYLGKVPSRYGSGAFRAAKFRFDGAAPYEIQAYYDGNTANFIDVGEGKPANRLLKDMASSKRMVVALTNYEFESVGDAFDLLDAREVILKAAQTCGDTALTM